jgi:hypothetical protein
MASTLEVEERQRRRFRPFIWIHTVDGAHSFLTALGESQVKVLWLPSAFEDLPAPEQFAVVQRRVREHYQETGGEYVGFGRIQAYRFVNTFDTSILLDVGGNVVERSGGIFPLPQVWLELA